MLTRSIALLCTLPSEASWHPNWMQHVAMAQRMMLASSGPKLALSTFAMRLSLACSQQHDSAIHNVQAAPDKVVK